MTKKVSRDVLIEVLGLFVQAVDSVNDACADEDRGRGDKQFVLCVWEDGTIAWDYGGAYPNPRFGETAHTVDGSVDDNLYLSDAISFKANYKGRFDEPEIVEQLALELDILDGVEKFENQRRELVTLRAQNKGLSEVNAAWEQRYRELEAEMESYKKRVWQAEHDLERCRAEALRNESRPN